jgi:hypothetical protein
MSPRVDRGEVPGPAAVEHLHAIALERAKTDPIDAGKIAGLLRGGPVPQR